MPRRPGVLLCALLTGMVLWPFHVSLSAATSAAGNDRDGEFILEIADASEEPVGRLLALPAATRSVEPTGITTSPVSVAIDNERVHFGPIMVMRGVPVAPVWLEPATVGELARSGVQRLSITFRARDAQRRELRIGAECGFPMALGLEHSADDSHPRNRGGYLIITADAYADVLDPLIDWKAACGYDVRLVRTSETGRTLAEIESFVRNAYQTWENPPLYLLLVGDVEDIPSGDLLGNVTDHVYACVDGGDFLADLYVGRFAAKAPEEVAVQVAKTVRYESQPDTTEITRGDGSTWFNRALMVAANEGSATPIPTCDWVADEFGAAGWEVTKVYDPPFTDGCSQLYGCPIGDAINDGVSIVNYRGWARENPPGWDVPDYTTVDIARLANGWKLPFVFSIVCNTGDFGRPTEDCFGEVWLKSGTVDEPRGAVGFIGTGEHWSKTRWNDRIDLEIFKAIRRQGVRQVGPVLAAAKAALLVYFPTEIYLAGAFEKEAAEFYAYVYNILADPSLQLWTARPRTVRIAALPSSIAYGINFLTLGVTAQDGETPIEAARIAFTQGHEVIGYGVTNALGEANVSLALSSADPVLCTVTGTDLYPYQVTLPVLSQERSLTCSAAEVSGSDFLTPGSAADVFVTLKNTGSTNLPAGTAIVSGPPGVTVIEGATEFGPIAAGATGQSLQPLRVRPAAGTEDGAWLRFVLTPTAGGAELPPTEFWLTAGAPDFTCEALTDGGDGVFDPGEEFNLILTLCNQGAISGGTVHATLAIPVPGATLIDSTAAFAEIPPDSSSDNALDPFVIRLDPHLAVGTTLPLRVTIATDDGIQSSITSNLVVGAVDCATPVGPDAGGYYAYDSADIDYPRQAPAYRWIEISPRYGGPGTWLGIDIDDRVPRVVSLPFTFTYYDQPFDSILVSDNGWIAFDTTYFFDTRNWAIPDLWGGASMVAAFWDNLKPEIPDTDGIYAWHDEAGHRFVVEWNRIKASVEALDWQSFEIVLYDPTYNPTATGNGEIVFQYKHIVNDDWMAMYSTVGIEDPTEEIGIQYSYSGLYAPGAAPLAPGLAIRFTTDAPFYEPITLQHFEADWSASDGGGVRVAWQPSDDRPLAGFELWRAAEVSPDGPQSAGERVHSGMLAATARSFTDRAADPTGRYIYRLRAIGAGGAQRALGETVYAGSAQGTPQLRLLGSTPASAGATLHWQAGPAGICELAVYDAGGRRVRTLVQPVRGAPRSGVLTWDGRDDAGQRVASGLYWVRLVADAERRTARLVIIR